ncbi:IPT/TIG domain-containing protein [Glaciihabitans sp. dw_435]|uniref:IPT/TIG domain-containing protein n=1 Tax=Glaciihabitans sp. dw_435 TaxID=2720081 RepID=UPI001BD4A705|nr:IPT/TIG domain-containing protein [Glaciihabitans sp. dw_435]
MPDQTLYNTTAQTEGTLALAHEKLLRIKRAGVFENITGDCNNIADVATPATINRENYGNKGRTATQKIGDNHVVSFDVEAVRDSSGVIAQPWLVPLLNIAKASGSANFVDLQLFDAKDPALGAIQGSFAVAVADLTTGFADKGGYKFTLTSNGAVQQITSPIAGTGVPVLESALPTARAAGQNVVVKGYGLTTVTAATIGGVAAASITQVVGNDNYVVLEVPAGTAGSAPIVVTNALGASTALPYNRGA